MDWLLTKATLVGVLTSTVFVMYFVSMILDNVLGYSSAFVHKELSSAKARVGFFRHITTTMIIITTMFFFYYFGMDKTAMFIPLWYVVINALSIIENYEKLGGQVPKFVKDQLNVKKENMNEGVEK